MLEDKFLKQQEARFSSEPYISEVVHIHQASKGFGFLASDGLWDVNFKKEKYRKSQWELGQIKFELLAEELLMSESVIKVYGALRMSVKMFLMWNSTMLIDGGGDANVETSLVEARPGDCIEAQRLVLSLFYRINLGLGSVLRGPLEDAKTDAVTPRLNCELQSCPIELLHPPEDFNRVFM
ncbi:Protein phosphatase 2C 70 [Camellia lanceoleosa]|uniref:Protein phosphatase 2C 70 n=1 Tax=Camellia lanceoleosa TaxID=1840588 RepID=A0ACC0H9W8_9ERIC|nr:Protein phosphatase 2C 70 [Camellia lanceoleosa]